MGKTATLHTSAFLLAACLATLVAAGGTGDRMTDDGESGGTTPVPVAFGATVKPQQADTRAATNGDITTDNITSMGVLAFYTGQSNIASDADIPNFMNDEKITRADKASPWTYSPVKYWPNKLGDKISFYAYSPHSSEMPAENGTSNFSFRRTRGTLELLYTVPTEEADQADLLWADVQFNVVKRAAPIGFQMKHILTKVEIRINATETIKVTSLRLEKIPLYQAYWPTSNSATTKWIPVPQGYQTPRGNYNAGLNSNPVAVAADTPTSLATFYLQPYTPDDKGNAAIVFNYEGSGKTSITIPLPTEVDDPRAPKWKEGGYVIYTIVVEGGAKISVSTTDIGPDWPSTPTDGGSEDVSAM